MYASDILALRERRGFPHRGVTRFTPVVNDGILSLLEDSSGLDGSDVKPEIFE